MRFERSWTMAVVVGVISLTTGGWLLNHGDAGRTVASERLLEEVHQLIAAQFVDEIPPEQLYQYAIEGMLKELGDPYTDFLDEDEWEQLRYSTTGNYGGLGVRIDDKGGWITIVAVMPGTPAEQQGLIVGDRIIQVEGESAEGWTPDKAVQELRGPKGSPVNILVARSGVDRPLQVRIVRDEIHVVQVRAFRYDDRIGYVQLIGFSRVAQDELVEAIDALIDEGVQGLVLDLRGNPGGLLEEGIAVTDLFLPAGDEVVETRSRVANQNYLYRAREAERYEKIPVVVLVDQWSASASEIVAGALQDHDRAVVVGSTTFGKGSVQTLFRLSGNNHIKITTAKWYTPVGRSIQKEFDRDAAMRELANSAVSVDGSPVSVEDPEEEGRETFVTDAGRTVYGGGGITPDLIVTRDTLTTDEQLFRRASMQAGVVPRDAVFRWAVDFAAVRNLVPDFPITQEMRNGVFAQLEEDGAGVERDMFDRAVGYVDWLIGRELAGAAFGEAPQLRRGLTRDSQFQKALELLQQADTPERLLAVATRAQSEQMEEPSSDGGQ